MTADEQIAPGHVRAAVVAVEVDDERQVQYLVTGLAAPC
jgi:hypothetical protein